jgi:hypothetical protein
MTNVAKHVVETAIALNLIYDIIERVQQKSGVTITPENIGAYVAERRATRATLNNALGVTAPDETPLTR